MFGTARATTFGYCGSSGTAPAPVAPPARRRTHLHHDSTTSSTTRPGPCRRRPAGPRRPARAEQRAGVPTRPTGTSTDGTGNLVIEARRETMAGSSCPGGPCQYTSGRINTQGKFSFTYGHVEARIKVSGTQGLWPAFWLLGANFPTVGWPASGEIDVMEHVGRAPSQVFSTIHAPAYNGGGGIGSPFSITGDFAAVPRTEDWDASHPLRRRQPFFTLSKAQVEATAGMGLRPPFWSQQRRRWRLPDGATTAPPQRMLSTTSGSSEHRFSDTLVLPIKAESYVHPHRRPRPQPAPGRRSLRRHDRRHRRGHRAVRHRGRSRSPDLAGSRPPRPRPRTRHPASAAVDGNTGTGGRPHRRSTAVRSTPAPRT